MSAMEYELDNLIDDLSRSLRSPVTHRSRYYTTYNVKNFNEGRMPSKPIRNTAQKGWYQHVARETGTPRSITPILKRTTEYSKKTVRPNSYLSRSISPHSPTPRSPILRPVSPRLMSRSPTRSMSPRREKSVVIGPVTEMVTKQEYFRHRDASQGKPLPGSSEFFRGSWPYGLNEQTNHPKRVEYNHKVYAPRTASPRSFGSSSSLNKDPLDELRDFYQQHKYRGNRSPSPGYRRAKSADPLKETQIKVPRSVPYTSAPSSPIPGWMRNLKHIVVEQIPVPVPPRFGTLTHGRKQPDYAEGPTENGPPCELCHEPITERRCIIAENCKYHCWHFVCSFCSKTLYENDFSMGQDAKPYCNNCFKRVYP